jgi:hypothetical protein
MREDFNVKLSSEITVVSDEIENVSRVTENKMTTLNNANMSMRECMNERMNAYVVHNRKEMIGRHKKLQQLRVHC